MTPETQRSDGPVPLLSVRNLTMSYARRSLLSSPRPGAAVLLDVSIEIPAGKTLALVGPSGSGKSSLARCILAIERPESGQVLYCGDDLLTLPRETLRVARSEIHLIFQESASALNSALRVERILTEPLAIHGFFGSRAERQARIREALERVELPASFLTRRPPELSGGQRQRVAIARSLMLRPRLLILDEALSSLDLSTQGQIGNLLLDLQERENLAYLFITHDLALASLLAYDVAVMNAGRIVQRGSPSAVLTPNLHTTGRALASNSPSSETVVEPWSPRGS